MKYSKLTTAVIFAAALFQEGVSYADCNFKKTSWPLPIKIEGVLMPSTVQLRLKSMGCDALLNSTSLSPGDAFEAKIAGYLAAGNRDAYNALVFPGAPSMGEFGLEKSILGGLPPTKIDVRFQYGALTYYLLGNGNPGSLVVPPPLVQQGNSFYTGWSYMLDPVLENLSSFAAFKNISPGKCSESFNKRQFHVRFDSPLPDNSGNKKASLEFNGKVMNFDIFSGSKSAIPGNFAGLINFYKNSFMKLKTGDQSGFLSDFSSDSQTKLSDEFNRNPAAFGAYQSSFIGKTHTLRFILDAGNIYYLFYTSLSDRSATLHYDVVINHNGRFQRVNIGYEGSMDRLITNKTFSNALSRIIQNGQDFDGEEDDDE